MARKSAENVISKITEAVEEAAGKNPLLSLKVDRLETVSDVRITVNAVVQISKKRKDKTGG